MEVSTILRANAVKAVATASSKKRLFQALGDISHAAYGLDQGEVFNALQERESLGPTGVGQGIALPHARLEGLEGVCGMFLRLEKPMDFDAVDKQPVDLIFALLAPKEAGVDHLKALALVSRTMRNSDICAKLRANSEASTLHAVLTDAARVAA